MAGNPDYFEIGTPDPEQTQRFYGSLFEWTFGAPSPAGYSLVNGGKGGTWDTTSMGGSSWAVFYVQVDDVKESIAQARSLGASVALPYVDNGSIEFAHLLDPQGNRFGIWRPKQPD